MLTHSASAKSDDFIRRAGAGTSREKKFKGTVDPKAERRMLSWCKSALLH